MWAVFSRTLRDRRILLLIYVLAAIAFLWMYIALFPSFKSQSASLEALIKNYPQSFLKAFNFDIKSFTTLEGYISTEEFSFVWPLLLMFMVIGYAGSALAGEIEKGTIEILLSQPISRFKFYVAKYIAGIIFLVTYVTLTIYAIIPLANLYNISFNASNFSRLTVVGLLFALAVYSIAYLVSAIFSDRGKVYFITGALLVVMYVLNILASIKDSLNFLKYYSFFYYFNPANVLVRNDIDKWAYVVFATVALITFIIGAIYFSKRSVTN